METENGMRDARDGLRVYGRVGEELVLPGLNDHSAIPSRQNRIVSSEEFGTGRCFSCD